MRITYWIHSEVNEDGTIGNPVREEEGCLDAKGGFKTSGNHNAKTPSTEKDNLWILVSSGRLEDGTIHGITIYFENEMEMYNFEMNGGCYSNEN